MPAPGVEQPEEPEVGIVTPPLPMPGITPRAPFMALLLPLQSPDFRAVADAFVRGVEAASQQRPGRLPVEVHPTDASPEGIYQTYAQLLPQGAAVVVGPMTRSGVSAIASSGLVMVPTLTLNQPEANVSLPSGLYAFGLSVEDEARMLARRAFKDGLRRIGIVGIPTPLSRRTREAFLAEWRQLGGEASVTLEAQPNSDLTQMRSMLTERTLDGIFLSAQYQEARMIRPYLPAQIPVYATSQVNIFPPDPVGMVDLNGVRFIDMPWLLSQDYPSVASFPRPMDLSGDVLRFYALGVDAYLIATQLADGHNRFDLDGLTGHLSVHSDGTIERRPRAAVFQDGVPTLIE